MTIAIFLGSLLAAMALGIPIAFSLLLCGAALMWHMNMFDAQILAQNLIEGSNSFPLLAVPFFMLAGEVMNACLLYTSDAADDLLCVDLGGRRLIKKKKKRN